MRSKSIYILLILTAVGAIAFIWAKGTHTNETEVKSVLYNIFSSVTVIFIIELFVLIQDLYKFSFLKGVYKRIKIFGENPDKKFDTKYVDITEIYLEKKVPSEIILSYSGDGKYIGYAFYDKGDKGRAKIRLNLDLENPMIGNGVYQYLDKSVIDLGTYIFQVDIDKKNIYIFYSNLLPSGLVKGYEIWQKI